jgi:transposase-like protein
MTTSNKNKTISLDVKEILAQDGDLLRNIIREVIQEFLEAEMDEALGASKSERVDTRLGYRSGYYSRELTTRVGKIELRVPRDRQGRFSTEIFDRYQRSEKALVLAIAEMYVQGVSTRDVSEIAEELFGDSISASSVSRLNKSLDQIVNSFANRKLEKEYPYLILDARYEKVRENGVVSSKAILIAIGVNWEGKREILAVEIANRESANSWKEFISKLKARGLHGVQLVISDAHIGLQTAITEFLTNALWQRCFVHFLRNAKDYIPRKCDDSCLDELKFIYEQRSIEDAHREFKVWVDKWADKHEKLISWAEENIFETLTFYRFPPQHRIHLRSSNVLERVNQEIKRRTQVVRIFPSESSALRLIRAIGAEIDEKWSCEQRYLNMGYLKELTRVDLLKAM